jgi:hypothetical protein
MRGSDDRLNDSIPPLVLGAVSEELSPEMAQNKVEALTPQDEDRSTSSSSLLLKAECRRPVAPEVVVVEPTSAPNSRGCRDGPITTDQKWRGELAKLTGLVEDMKEQQAVARGEMLRLHNEQLRELKVAINRMESSAPRCCGPPSEKSTVPAGDPTEKSAARKDKPNSEISTHDASQVSHPFAVQDLAEAVDKDIGQNVDVTALVRGRADANVPGEGSASVRLSDESRTWRRRNSFASTVTAQTLQTMRRPVEIYKKIKRFLEVAQLHYGSDARKRGESTNLQLFVTSFYFQAIVSAAILVNAVCIGCQVDSQLKSTNQEQVDEEWHHVEICFTVFFTLELIIRVAAERWAFVFGENWAWNLFDTVLVFESLVDLVLVQSAAPNISFARVLRLVRFTRVLRILRAMRSCQTLRVMIFSIFKSMASLLWVFALILFVIYFFAVLFASGVVEVFNPADSDASPVPDLVAEKYGSVTDVMLSLFMCISGGDDWSVMVTPLYDVNIMYVALFVVYIFFMAFGVLNVVVGHFVENAAKASQKDRDSVVKNELKQEKEYCLKMQRIFKDADKDGDGELTWTEFEEYLSNGTTAAYFSTAGLDANIAKTLFRLLDVDDTDRVGIDEFVGGCMRLKGAARSIDVNMLLYETEKMCYKLTEFIEDTTKTLHELASDTVPGARRKNGPGDPDMEYTPLHSPAVSRENSGLSNCQADLQEFRRRHVRPCAALAGSEFMVPSGA